MFPVDLKVLGLVQNRPISSEIIVPPSRTSTYSSSQLLRKSIMKLMLDILSCCLDINAYLIERVRSKLSMKLICSRRPVVVENFHMHSTLGGGMLG